MHLQMLSINEDELNKKQQNNDSDSLSSISEPGIIKHRVNFRLVN